MKTLLALSILFFSIALQSCSEPEGEMTYQERLDSIELPEDFDFACYRLQNEAVQEACVYRGDDCIKIFWDSTSTDTPITCGIPDTSGTFVDARDNQEYRWVNIGLQTWMAENLNFNPEGHSGYTNQLAVCYANDTLNCNTYGRLYDWVTVMNLDTIYGSKEWNGPEPHQGICPSGWHVPSIEEWELLDDYVWMKNDFGVLVGILLKSKSGNWGYEDAFDSFGLAVEPAGGGDREGNFASVGKYTIFSTTSKADDSRWIFGWAIGGATEEASRVSSSKKSDAISLRCIKDTN